MPEFRRISAAMAFALALLAAGPAAAQDADDEDRFRPRFEITPFAGYRFGGDFDYEDDVTPATNIELGDAGSFGVSLGLYRDGASFYELYYSRQSAPMQTQSLTLGDIDLLTEYYHVGGTLLFVDRNWFVPYLSMTVGMTRFDPDADGLTAESDFSLSLGTGVRMPVTEKLSVLVGFRGYLTFVDSSSSLFCASSGGAACVFRITGSSFFQVEGQLGLTLRF